MAQMIPDAMPPGSSIGEKLLFSRLQALDDSCLVYYEPPLGDRYPDFVVILPDVGLLVIEMKGWLPHQILGGDSHNVRIRLSSREGEKVSTNPIRQARDYMHRLMDLCRRHPAAKHLLHKSGSHDGKFIFPFGYCAVLSQVTEDQLQRHASGNLRAILPPEHVVAADEFEQWPALTEMQLTERLAAFFSPRWAFRRLDSDQISALRTIIHPEVLVPPTPAELAEVIKFAAQVVLIPNVPDLKSLDADQERTARSIGSGHRLLFGVAGSGKTIVLLARAKFLSQALPSGRILVLCFNVAFRSYLKALLTGHSNVDVYTFHGWGTRNGVRRETASAESPDEYGQKLLAALQGGSNDAGQYDAVLIDEAQDFDPSWFLCAKAAMKEPHGGDLLVVGDGSQTNYKRGRVSWAKLGITAQGRTRILRTNYRNTRAILEAAAPFANDAGNADGIPEAGCNPDNARRETNLRPVFVERPNRADEVASIEDIVRGLLSGAFNGQSIAPVRPSDIGIFYREKDDSIDDLLKRLGALAPAVWLSRASLGGDDPRQKVLDPGIKVQTIFSAKGLQYRAVILMFTDQLGRREEDIEKNRRLLYVALTRPEEILVVTCTTPSSRHRTRFIEELSSSAAFGRA